MHFKPVPVEVLFIFKPTSYQNYKRVVYRRFLVISIIIIIICG